MRSVLRDLAKAALVTLAFLALIEGGLELGDMQLAASFTMPDPQRGFRLRPGAHGWHLAEGRNYQRINSLGFEDVERTLHRSPGTLRIAVLGSSTVQSEQVPPERAFPGVMEQKLRASGQLAAHNVEVLNFGVGAYSLPAQWMMLRDDIWKYDPQIVIEAMNIYNDIVNSDRHTSVSGRPFPYFVAANGQLIPDGPIGSGQALSEGWLEWRNRWRDFENRFKLLLLVEKAIRDIVPGQNWQPGLSIDPHQTSTFHPPTNPHLQNAWKVTETALALMQAECAAHHAEFWVVTTDFHFQTEPDPAVRESDQRFLGVTDVYYPNRRIAEFCQREGIHVFSLAPLLADYALAHRVALHGFFNTPVNFGHYNEVGHAVVADFIVGELLQRSERLRAPID